MSDDDVLGEILGDSTKRNSEHPSGWEPAAEFNGERLEVTSRPTFDAVDWGAEFGSRGLDADQWQLDGPVQFRYWDAAIGGGETRQMRYFRAQFRPATERAFDEAHVASLVAHIRKRKLGKRKATPQVDTMVVCIADTQVGKPEGGGTDALIERFMDRATLVARHIERVKPRHLLIASLGDIVESCDNHYAMQSFGVDRDRRGQLNVASDLLTHAITLWAPLAEDAVVAACGGNHGENRKGGKAFTAFGDNDDLLVWEIVRRAIDADGRYNVGWVIPTGDELNATVQIGGAVVGLTHGHMAARSQGASRSKVWEWWKGQMAGRLPFADVDIALSGHWHHLSVWEPTEGRVHIQAPSLDGGSEWFTKQTGMRSKPGMLTFTIDDGEWNRLVVL